MRETVKKYIRRPKDAQERTWYIFYSGKASLLSTEALFKSTNHKFLLWIPGYKVCQVKQNDVVTSIKKAFPGYIFVSFMGFEPTEGIEREAWLTGVESQLKMQDPQFKLLRPPGGKAIGYTDTQLECIDEIIAELDDIEQPESVYHVGDYVRIISGPFAGMIGQISEMQKKTVSLKVFFLKQQVKMVVQRAHLPYLVQKNAEV